MERLQPEVREASCPEHGAYQSRHIFGRVWSQCPQCTQAERERQQAEEAERERRRAEEEHRQMIAASCVPARFTGRTFSNFVADTPQKVHALSVVRDFAEQFDANSRAGRGLILAGMPGTGKSHLAGAALLSLLPRRVRYLTCLDLIRAVRDTWRRDSERSEVELLAYLERLDLLCIDEVGVQYGTDGEQTILFDVLDRRYREVRPTIIITNQDKAGLKSFIGDRSFDRLVETSRWVPFDWPSYRATARQQ